MSINTERRQSRGATVSARVPPGAVMGFYEPRAGNVPENHAHIGYDPMRKTATSGFRICMKRGHRFVIQYSLHTREYCTDVLQY